ncbi:multicopper oxidase, type 3 domain protein [Mycobacterium xenopi 4042]|uniref:Multicopper oxidase, type 3 domain protein n=1 Tax=Mycobacterium xenopi 4042 TaxID=1299334 RepID=X8A9K6_MYCXE|nr:multicopper oxidase, type 3 domain protein [Mycobacterium xenopi 4042]
MTVIECPASATRKAVSEPALMNRIRIRCPGLTLKVLGAAGIRPLTR